MRGIFSRKRRPTRAAILGCGPAGIFAAQGFAEAGWDVRLYSRKRKSDLFGAQYLIAPVPGLKAVSTQVDYILKGTWEVSTQKVYGMDAVPEVPWDNYISGRREAWDIRAAYLDGYAKFEPYIIDVNVDQPFLAREFGSPEAKNYWGAIVSTIPAPVLCARPREHAFLSSKLWASGDAPERGLWSPVTAPDDTVIIDGTWERAWYRASKVFGHSTCEWPHDRRPPISNVAEVLRPMGTTCDCWPQIARAGRYGAWNKSEFSHHAYELARLLVKEAAQ